MIFYPGFSTAKEVTNISGRGVGMDIVKKKIEELSGTLEIQTVPQKGTTFLISLPLTLATQKCLMSEIYDSVYAIPLENVQEIVQVRDRDLYSVQNERFARVRNQVIAVRTLEMAFPKTDFIRNGFDSLKNRDVHTLVIVSTDEGRVALPVQKLLGEESIVVKSLTRHFQDVSGVAGVSILGTGKIALILDVSHLTSVRKTLLATSADGSESKVISGRFEQDKDADLRKEIIPVRAA